MRKSRSKIRGQSFDFLTASKFKSEKTKNVGLGVVKKRALRFLRYLDKHGRYSLSKLCYTASRPKIEMRLVRPLEVTATSNLGHFIFPYRTFSVPSFIKIGDGDFHFCIFLVDLIWTDPNLFLIFPIIFLGEKFENFRLTFHHKNVRSC